MGLLTSHAGRRARPPGHWPGTEPGEYTTLAAGRPPGGLERKGFAVTLRKRRRGPPPLRHATRPKMKLLIADDQPGLCLALAEQTRPWGYEPSQGTRRRLGAGSPARAGRASPVRSPGALRALGSST